MREGAITTSDAPIPNAPISQARVKGGVLALAGQIGVDPATGDYVSADVVEQAVQALKNTMAVLAAAGCGPADVISTRLFVTDIAHIPLINEVYTDFFQPPYPARTSVAVGLPAGMLVEIDCIAVPN